MIDTNFKQDENNLRTYVFGMPLPSQAAPFSGRSLTSSPRLAHGATTRTCFACWRTTKSRNACYVPHGVVEYAWGAKRVRRETTDNDGDRV